MKLVTILTTYGHIDVTAGERWSKSGRRYYEWGKSIIEDGFKWNERVEVWGGRLNVESNQG